jgi:hypothetical protein
VTLPDERLQVCAETVGFFGGEYLAHGLIQGGPDGLGGSEGDQPVAATHVEHRMSRCYVGVGDDLVAYRCQTFELLTKQIWVAAVAALKKPGRPLVVLRSVFHAFSASRTCANRGTSAPPALASQPTE